MPIIPKAEYLAKQQLIADTLRDTFPSGELLIRNRVTGKYEQRHVKRWSLPRIIPGQLERIVVTLESSGKGQKGGLKQGQMREASPETILYNLHPDQAKKVETRIKTTP
jgi:hypothetical protein